MNDPSFLPRGCKLGFGLSHKYPVTEGTKLAEIILKGYDVELLKAFETNGVKGQLKAFYSKKRNYNNYMDDSTDDEDYDESYDDENDQDDEDIGGEKCWLSDKIVQLPKHRCENTNTFETTCRESGAVKVLSFEKFGEVVEIEAELNGGHKANSPMLLWVTPPSENA